MSDTTGIAAFLDAMDEDQEPAIQSVDANVDISSIPGLGPAEDDDISSSEDETVRSDWDSGSEDSDSDDSYQEEDDFFEEEIEEEEEEDDEEEEEETTATTTDVQSNSLYYDPNNEDMDFEIEEIRSGLEQMQQDLKEMKSMSFNKPFDAQFIAKSERILRNVDNVTSKFPRKSFQLGDVAGEISIDLDSITVMSKYFKDVFKLYDTTNNYIRWQMSPMIYLMSMTSSRIRVGVKDNPNVRKLGKSVNTRNFPSMLLGRFDILHDRKDGEDGRRGKTFEFEAYVYLTLLRPKHYKNSYAKTWNHLPKELIQCVMVVLNLSRKFIKGQIPITINGRIRSFPNTTQGNMCREQLEQIKSVIEQFQTNKDAKKNIDELFASHITSFDYKIPKKEEELKKKGSFKAFQHESAEIMMTLFDLILELLSMNAFGLEIEPEGPKCCLRDHLESLFAVCTDDGTRKSKRLNKQIIDSDLDKFNTIAAFNKHLHENKHELSKYCAYLKKHSFFQVVAAGTKSANPCFEVPLDGEVTQLQTTYAGTIQTFRNFLTDLFHKETLKSKNVSLLLDVGFNFSPKPAFKAFVLAPRLQLKGKKNQRLTLQSQLRASDTEGQFSALFQNNQDNSTSRNDVDETTTSDENSIDGNNESDQSSESSPKFCAILTRSPEKRVFFSGIQFYEQYPLLLSSHAYSQHTSGTPFCLQNDGCLVGHELERPRRGRGALHIYGKVVGINSYIRGLRQITRCNSFATEIHNFVELPFLMRIILKWDGFSSLTQSEMKLMDNYLNLLRRTKYFQTPPANMFSDESNETLVCRHEMFVDASNGIEGILDLDILHVLGTEVALISKPDIGLRYFAMLEKCRQMILHCFTEPDSSKRINMRNAVTGLDGIAKSNLLYAAELFAHCHPSSSVTCQTLSENMGLFQRNLYKCKPHLPIHMPLSNIEPLLSNTVSCIAEDGGTIDIYGANLESFTAAPVLSHELQYILKDFESNDEQNISVAGDHTLMINLANEYQRLHKAKCATLHHNYRTMRNHKLTHYVKMLALSELIDCIDNFEKIENVKRYVCVLFWACYRLQIQEDLYMNGYGSSSTRPTSDGLGPMSKDVLNGIIDSYDEFSEKIITIDTFIEHLFRCNHVKLIETSSRVSRGNWQQCTYLICFQILKRKIEVNPGIMYSTDEINSGFSPTALLENSLLESFLQFKYEFLHYTTTAKRCTIPPAYNSNNDSSATVVLVEYHCLKEYIKKPLHDRFSYRLSDDRSPFQQRMVEWDKPDAGLTFFGQRGGKTTQHATVQAKSTCNFMIVFRILKDCFNYSDESWKEMFENRDTRVKFELVKAIFDIFHNKKKREDFNCSDERITIADSHKFQAIADSGLLNLIDIEHMKYTVSNLNKNRGTETMDKIEKRGELRASFLERFLIEEGGKFRFQLKENQDVWVTVGGVFLNKFFQQTTDKKFVDFYEKNKELYSDILGKSLEEQATSIDILRKWSKILQFIIGKEKGFQCIGTNGMKKLVHPSQIDETSEMFGLTPATMKRLKEYRGLVNAHLRGQNENSIQRSFPGLVAQTWIVMTKLLFIEPPEQDRGRRNHRVLEEKNTTQIIISYQNKYPTECRNIFEISSSVDGNRSIAETENNRTRDISMEGETGTSSNTISNSSNNEEDVEMDDAVVLDEFSVMEVEAGIGEDAHIGEAAVMEVEATTMSNTINDENVKDFSLDERYTPESLEALMKCKAIITPDSDEELMTIFTPQKKQDLEDQGIEFDKDLLAQYEEVRCESRLKLEAFLFSECDDSDEDSFPSDDEDDHRVRFIKNLEPILDQKRSQFVEIMNKTELNDSEVETLTDAFDRDSKLHPHVEPKALGTLQPGKWLSSDIINYFYEYIQFLDRMDKQETLIFDSSFYQELLGPDRQGFQKLKKRCIKSDISKYKYVLIPCNINDNHWILTRFSMEKRIIEFYDSFNKKHEYLFQKLKELMKSVTKHDFDFQYERVIPQQSNSHDCGIYTCLYGYYLYFGKDIDFTEENFDLTRQKIVLLITSRYLVPDNIMIFSSDQESSDCSENSESNDSINDNDDDDGDINIYQHLHNGTFQTYGDKCEEKRKRTQDFLMNKIVKAIHDSARKKK